MAKEPGQFIPINEVRPVKRLPPSNGVIQESLNNRRAEEGPWRKVPWWMDTSTIPNQLITTTSQQDRNITIVPQAIYTDVKRQKEGIPPIAEKNQRSSKKIRTHVPPEIVETISNVIFEQPSPEPQIPDEEQILPETVLDRLQTVVSSPSNNMPLKPAKPFSRINNGLKWGQSRRGPGSYSGPKR